MTDRSHLTICFKHLCYYYLFDMQQPVERVLDKIGKVGKYQKLLVAYLFFIAGFVNYLLMGPTYIYMNPVFQCTFADDLVDESIACDRLTECAISTPLLSQATTIRWLRTWHSTASSRPNVI